MPVRDAGAMPVIVGKRPPEARQHHFERASTRSAAESLDRIGRQTHYGMRVATDFLFIEAHYAFGRRFDLGVEDEVAGAQPSDLRQKQQVMRSVIEEAESKDGIYAARLYKIDLIEDVADDEPVPLGGDSVFAGRNNCGVHQVGAAFDAGDVPRAGLKRRNTPSPVVRGEVENGPIVDHLLVLADEGAVSLVQTPRRGSHRKEPGILIEESRPWRASQPCSSAPPN